MVGSKRATHAQAKSALGAEAEGPNEARLSQALRFMRTLWLLDHSLSRRSKNMGATLGITGPQRLVLRVVGRNPGIAAGAIARTLHLDKSTMTGILQRLEDRGFLRRSPDPEDGRISRFALTSAGARLDRHDRGTIEAAVRRLLNRLPPEQIEVAEHVLQELSAELDRDG